MKRRPTLIIVTICLLMLLGGAALWLFIDEAPLDYSAFDLKLGSSDPAVNGYALISEYVESEAWMNRNRDKIDIQKYIEETGNYVPWTKEEIEALLAANEELIVIAEESFNRPEFANYQPPDNTPNKAVRFFLDYTYLVVLKAKLLEMNGDPDGALLCLVEHTNRLRRYGQMPDVAFGKIFSMAIIGITHAEIYSLINQRSAITTALRQALPIFELPGAFNNCAECMLPWTFLSDQGEITMALDDPEYYSTYIYSDIPPVISTFLARYPLFGLKVNKTNNKIFQIYLEEIRQESFPYNLRKNNQYLSEMSRLSSKKKWFSNNLMGDYIIEIYPSSYFNTIAISIQFETARRAIYLLVAIALYFEEHGELPPTLEALVPEYISAVPLDPYDGQPLRYDPSKRIIYSVGDDGVDSGGSTLPSQLEDNETENSERDKAEPTFHIRFEELTRSTPVSN